MTHPASAWQGAPEPGRAHWRSTHRARGQELTDVLVIGGGIAGARRPTTSPGPESGSRCSSATGSRRAPARRRSGCCTHRFGNPTTRWSTIWARTPPESCGSSASGRWRGSPTCCARAGEAGHVELDRSGSHVLAESHTRELVRGAYDAMAARGLPVRWLTPADARELTGGRRFSGGYTIEGGGALDPTAASPP